MKTTRHLSVRVSVTGEPFCGVDFLWILHNEFLSKMISEHPDSIPCLDASSSCFKNITHFLRGMLPTRNVLIIHLRSCLQTPYRVSPSSL